MILQALCKLYDKLSDILPQYGMAYVKFHYAIVIDEAGNFLRFESLGDGDGLNVLTSRPEERTSSPVAHLMGDNGSYVLSLKKVVPGKTNLAAEMKSNAKNYDAFRKSVELLHSSLPENETAKSVALFYSHFGLETISQMEQDPEWPEVCKLLSKNITFRIQGHTDLAAGDRSLVEYHVEQAKLLNQNEEKICLVTGQKERPVFTTTSTFIPGGKSNAKMVAFQVNSGYDSYGKKQGLNAPISESAEFKYTTALLYLLRSGSKNKFAVGSRTYVFWASSKTEASNKMEQCLFSVMGKKSDPDEKTEGTPDQVIKVLKGIFSGTLKTSLEEKFYILGLAPNAARISVVFWSDLPLRDFAGHLLRHYDDMEISGYRDGQKPYKGLYNILGAITLKGRVSDVVPNLSDAVVKSIFMGLPYPVTLMKGCIQRIRAERNVGITRAAILKACINRTNHNQKSITVMLDKENTNQGYLCGRLFAVLDKVQSEASNNHSTIKERYMNAASSSPSTVFPTILNLSEVHSEKLQEGRRVYFEKLKQEIISKLDAEGFPTHLGLGDQGRFFIGYYHQIQEFFTKKEDREEV